MMMNEVYISVDVETSVDTPLLQNLKEGADERRADYDQMRCSRLPA